MLTTSFARTSHAAAPTLAGTWTQSALSERWNIGQWGNACGPRPASRDVPGGNATVREEGPELAITSSEGTFKTSGCFEALPGLLQSSHSVTLRSWQSRCVSAPNDPRQTTLVTTLTATDTTMTLDETGAYQFRYGGQNCTASARRTRTFRLVLRQGETPAATSTVPAAPVATTTSAPAPTTATPPFSRPSTAGKCSEVGDPVRLEVTPFRKLMRPGEHFTFRTLSFDADGCPVTPRVAWSVATPDAHLTVAPGGTVTVGEDAEDGVVELLVSFAGKAARVRVEVATPAHYDALLSAGSVNDAGEGDEAAATIVTSGSLSANSAVAEDGARARKTTFVIIIGSLALGLAALGFLLLRRSNRSAAAKRQASPAAATIAYIAPGSAPFEATAFAPVRPFRGAALVCPACKFEFSTGTTFCPRDGTRLAPAPDAAPGGIAYASGAAPKASGVCPTCGREYAPDVSTCPTHGVPLVPAEAYRPQAPLPAAVPERGKICPSCGGRYSGEATFCGKDGTALVLVN